MEEKKKEKRGSDKRETNPSKTSVVDDQSTLPKSDLPMHESRKSLAGKDGKLEKKENKDKPGNKEEKRKAPVVEESTSSSESNPDNDTPTPRHFLPLHFFSNNIPFLHNFQSLRLKPEIGRREGRPFFRK